MNDETETDVKPRVTNRALAERGLDALDVSNYGGMSVDNVPQAGQISNVDWLKVIELGKALAGMQDGMPPHVRGHWGIGCRIAAHAQIWQMDPFGIADQTYVVNNRLGYMSQLIHALINRNAKLMHRLSCEYTGKGADRQCIVRGQFITGDEREYVTPRIGDIKTQNSPLWKSDPDQQLWYFGVRSWGRKWVPEVVFGLYTKEELQEDKALGYEESVPGLHARLKGSERGTEGHHAKSIKAELENIVDQTDGAMDQSERIEKEIEGAVDAVETIEAVAETKPRRKAKAKAKAKDEEAEAKPKLHVVSKVAYPSTVEEYLAYARRWIKGDESQADKVERWNTERKLRNTLGMTKEERAPLEELMQRILGK